MVIAVALPTPLMSDIGGAGGGGGNGGAAAALAAIGEHELMEAPAPTTPVVIVSHAKGKRLRARVLCRHAVLRQWVRGDAAAIGSS